VHSSTECPSAGAIEAQLRALNGSASTSSLLAEVADDVEGLSLTLRDEHAAVLAQHRFNGAAPCDVRALTVAAVIAAWTGELRALPVAIANLRPSKPPKADYEVGAEFLAALAGTAFAAGGTVYGLVAPHTKRWAARFALLGTGNRSLSLGDGTIAWTHLAVSIGAAVRFSPRRFIIDLHADFLPSLLRMEGTGFALNGVAWAFDPGLELGVRAGLRVKTGTLSLGVGMIGWPRPESVRVGFVTEQRDVPRIDVAFSAGFAFGTF
jgi:hypothetical protein